MMRLIENRGLYLDPKKFASDGWSFEQKGYYQSNRGRCEIYITRWRTNIYPHIFTMFKVSINKKWHREFWEVCYFSEKTLQVKAARFLNKILKTNTL